MFDYPIMGNKLDLCNNRFTQTILHSRLAVKNYNESTLAVRNFVKTVQNYISTEL